MATIEFIPVAVCIDCASWAANNDDSGASPEWAELVDQPMPDPDPRTIRQYVSTLIIESGEESEEYFSWQTCDGCGSTLGGTRLDAYLPVDRPSQSLI